LRTIVQEDRILRHNQAHDCRKREQARERARRKRSEQKTQRQEENRKLTTEALMMVQARGTVRSHERPAVIRHMKQTGFLAISSGRKRINDSSYGGSQAMAQCLNWPQPC